MSSVEKNIAILKAAGDGRIIEFRARCYQSPWTVLDETRAKNGDLNFSVYEFREKKVPRMYYVAQFGDKQEWSQALPKIQHWDEFKQKRPNALEYFKVIEVIED